MLTLVTLGTVTRVRELIPKALRYSGRQLRALVQFCTTPRGARFEKFKMSEGHLFKFSTSGHVISPNSVSSLNKLKQLQAE